MELVQGGRSNIEVPQLPPLRQFAVTVISPDADGYPQEAEIEVFAHSFGMGQSGALIFNEYTQADEPAFAAVQAQTNQPVIVERVVRCFAKGAWGGFREVYIKSSVIATPGGRLN